MRGPDSRVGGALCGLRAIVGLLWVAYFGYSITLAWAGFQGHIPDHPHLLHSTVIWHVNQETLFRQHSVLAANLRLLAGRTLPACLSIPN